MTRSKLTAMLCILAGLMAQLVAAQAPSAEREVAGNVDWRTGRFHLEVRTQLSTETRNTPASAFRAEQSVEADLPGILQRHAADIQIDSYQNLGQHYRSRSGLAVEIANLADELHPTLNRQTPDLKFLELHYALDLYPHVIRHFITHSRTRPLPNIIPWRPSREFTGVVVYAKGTLPVHGEDRRARVRPALLPDILFGEQTGVVMKPNRVDPEVLEDRGAVAYATSLDDPIVAERAGSRPFRTLAVGVFGRTATDPIIPQEDAESFFAEPGNHQLIRDGRIVIILDESQLN